MFYVALLLTTLKRALRARCDLLIENLALRQQLAVYTRQERRPQLRDLFWESRRAPQRLSAASSTICF